MIIRIASIHDVASIREIAFETWPVAYSNILSKTQLDYMLEKFYNLEVLKQQIEESGHQFILATDAETHVGFASFSPVFEDGIYKIHKLYVQPNHQSNGIGKQLLNFIFSALQSKDCKKIILNVNRHNNAVQFYLEHGFVILKEEDIDIGNGFFMNDYVMELKLVEGG